MATELINSASDEYIHVLLSADSNVCYVVPKYQREYSWNKYQWEELIQDIQEEPEGRGHFLGTIICINTTINVVQENRLELVDGQQRMTTLSILLTAIYAHLSKFKSQLLDDEDYQQKWFNLRSRLVKNDQPRLRLQVQGRNAADYTWLLKSVGLIKDPKITQPHYWGVRRVAKAYYFYLGVLQAQLDELPEDEKLAHLFDLVDRVADSVLVKLEVKDHASAFTLFESLNNRGLELSPIDLIKNSLLARADNEGADHLDEAYHRWMGILAYLGPSATEQERFLRYYYNAFEPVPMDGMAVPIATRSNLIRLYEEFLDDGVDAFLDKLEVAAHEYGRVIGTVDDADEGGQFERMATRLQRAQGAPGNALLLYLLVQQDELGIAEDDVTDVADSLVRFFVRRNLTGFPATYELQRLFKSIIRDIAHLSGAPVLERIDSALREKSASDEMFRESLSGPIYEDNADMCRFILTALAEEAQTNETHVDLWERAGSGSKQYYVFTIEHIFPQGENIPPAWVDMMGGAEAAADTRDSHVHRLGNLTLTGYNSSLGAKSFKEKRDRMDSKNRPVGYRNGLALNADLRDATSWSRESIDLRTEKLVGQIMRLFSLK